MQGEVDAEGVASDFDLNSLIEGDVDDDDFGEQFAISRDENEESKTPVVKYFAPLKVSYTGIRLIFLLLKNNIIWGEFLYFSIQFKGGGRRERGKGRKSIR